MSFELPPMAQGTSEQQLAALRDYLVRLSRSLEQVCGAEAIGAAADRAAARAQKQAAADVKAAANTLKALIAIPENYYPLVKKGMQVNLSSEIYPGETFPATVEVVYPTVDPASHTFQAKLRIPNSGLKLRPGMYVKTRMSLGMARAMVVPYQAVLKLTGSNDRYVFVDDGGVARRVFVKLGQRFDENIEIISDELQEGDRLVTVGQAKLVDGSKLNVTKEN